MEKSLLEDKYTELCNTESDINEHLSILYEYATKCEIILELGVRSAVSSFAFIKGLVENDKINKKLVSCDINNIGSITNENLIKKICKENSIDYTFLLKNDLEINESDINNTDLTFIDT